MGYSKRKGRYLVSQAFVIVSLNYIEPEAPCESVNLRSMPQQKDGPLCISFFPEGTKKYPHHSEPLLVIGMR